MMTDKKLSERRYKKKMRRRELRKQKRRLMEQFGNTVGAHIYSNSRKFAILQELVMHYKRRHKDDPPAPLPRMVQAQEPPPKKRGFFKRLFGG